MLDNTGQKTVYISSVFLIIYFNFKYNPGKANNAKHSKTKLSWFSHLLQHSARKWGGLILQRSRAHMGLERMLIIINPGTVCVCGGEGWSDRSASLCNWSLYFMSALALSHWRSGWKFLLLLSWSCSEEGMLPCRVSIVACILGVFCRGDGIIGRWIPRL